METLISQLLVGAVATCLLLISSLSMKGKLSFWECSLTFIALGSFAGSIVSLGNFLTLSQRDEGDNLDKSPTAEQVTYEGDELTAFPSLPPIMAQECETRYTDDPVAVTACKVTRQMNLGISVNGRMTAHEKVIEKHIAITTELEARIAELEAQND